ERCRRNSVGWNDFERSKGLTAFGGVRWSAAFVAEVLIALLDGGGGLGVKLLEKFEQAGRVEEFQVVVRGGALLVHAADHDDGQFWVELFDGEHDVVGLHVADDVVDDDAVNGWEALDGLNGFSAGVCSDDVELCGLDDEFAGRDVGGKLAVDDEKAGTSHC